MEGEGKGDTFRDLHLGIMATFVNVKIVRFAVIVNKERKSIVSGFQFLTYARS